MNPQWRLSDIIFQVSLLLKESLNMVVMVNNSTNINTSNKCLLPTNHWTQKDHHDIWHWKSRSWLRTGWEKVVGLNRLTGTQPLPPDNYNIYETEVW